MQSGIPPHSSASDAPAALPKGHRSLWLVRPDYAYTWDHGAQLRTYALARAWRAMGSRTEFAVLDHRDVPIETQDRYFGSLADQGVLSEYRRYQVERSLAASLAYRIVPSAGARSGVLRAARRHLLDRVVERARDADVVVVPDAHWLFAIPTLIEVAPVVVEWRDSMTLFALRQRDEARARGAWADALRYGWHAREARAAERFLGPLVHANVFVSPVDAAAFAQASGRPDTVHVIPNGATIPRDPLVVERHPRRVVFSGNMDFPPNHTAVMWFIREILPKLVAAMPDVEFRVLGRNPQPELLACAGPNVVVAGYVEDMLSEIAKGTVYVAPMTAGSGFKNKVVDAMAAGTTIVGTGVALEFLPPPVRALLHQADSPDDFAAAVLACLRDPGRDLLRTAQFRAALLEHFDWSARARDLLRVAAAAVREFRHGRAA